MITDENLTKRVKAYNRIYFNNEIEYPIVVKLSKQLFNSHSWKHAYHIFKNDCHYIVLNVKLYNASYEILRNTLVHEMIHAWQEEYDPTFYDNFSKTNGHNEVFYNKCDELNKKFKFTYNLNRYASDNIMTQLSKHANDCFYVYVIEQDYYDPSTKYALGAFVKFLYLDEANHLKRNGLHIRYYKRAKFNNNVPINLKNKNIVDTDFLYTYYNIKNYTAKTLTRYNSWYLVPENNFNFKDGIEI